MKRRTISINVFSSASQVIVTGLVYFFLYKFLINKLGVEILGVWSVVLSTTSMANLANLGISTSVVRFVALYSENPNTEKVKDLIFTAFMILFVLFTAIGILIFFFSTFILNLVIETNFIDEAIKILPYSIGCLIINAMAGVYASTLDGIQKNYIRNVIFALSSILFLVLTYVFVPQYGLLGVALAQVCQSLFLLALCTVVVMMYLPHNPFHWRWNQSIFKDIFSYGIKFQFSSLIGMINDPLTKVLVTRFSGLEFTGYYEIASRIASQLRAVIVNANQSLTPVIVRIGLKSEEGQLFYRKTFVYIFLASLVSMTFLSLSSSTLSLLFIGKVDQLFLNLVVLLAIASCINLLTGPAYYSYVANGDLNNIVFFNFYLCVSNAILGFVLGYYFQGIGVIVGWILGLILSSLIMIAKFHKDYSIVSSGNIPIRYIVLILLSVISYYGQHLTFNSIEKTGLYPNMVSLLFWSLLFSVGSFFLLKGDIQAFLKRNSIQNTSQLN